MAKMRAMVVHKAHGPLVHTRTQDLDLAAVSLLGCDAISVARLAAVQRAGTRRASLDEPKPRRA